MRHQRQFLWFLFGLGSWLQVFGTSLCFTEIFVYAMAPFLFSTELPHMRRNGVMPLFWLSICLVFNAALSCLANHTGFAGSLRGMAVVCLLPCAIVVSHWMLRKDMVNFKWLLVGGTLSLLLCTFFFRRAVDVNMLAGGANDKNATDAIMSGPLFWIGQLGSWGLLYPKGWYLKCPLLLSAGLPVGLAAFALFTSTSGRGTAVRSLVSALLIWFGGKKASQIRLKICSRFWWICFLGVFAIYGFKTFYQTAATSGWLGEKAQAKYESQTKGNKGMLALLMGGRMESFCGMFAAMHKPIIGHGPWALDIYGYQLEFLRRFGNADDYARSAEMNAQHVGEVGWIPCHAYIAQFWCWYGVFGLVFWAYVIYLAIRHLRQDCWAIPQWYMWVAAGIPNLLWDVFFSPFAGRTGVIMHVVALLMVRAVRLGRQQLPMHMQIEIMKMERRGNI